jgi:L-rhamnose-H+ transport protein
LSSTLGFALVILAGGLNGSFALPLKRTSKWAWENTWLVYSIVGMVLVNWTIVLYTVPHLATVYERAGLATVAMVFVFGCLWGIANLLFGLGIDLIGISLTFPICLGISTALGALIPMARDPSEFLTPGGLATTLGVGVILLSISLCALAGLQKDAQITSPTKARIISSATGTRRRLFRGLVIVILAGLFDPMLNYALVFGERIKGEAVALGTARVAAGDAIWALALLGSFFINAAYCGLLLLRHATWSGYWKKGTFSHWGLAALMGLIWMLSITFYGRGEDMIGRLGPSIGWAVFYSCIILSSSIWGLVSGEWRGGEGKPVRTMFLGLLVLLVALFILGYATLLTGDKQ